jgi:hypothetical protein
MTKDRRTTAARLGGWLGGRWKKILHLQVQLLNWQHTMGVPSVIAKTLIWILNICLIGLLLYVAFWMAVLLLLAIGVARLAAHSVTPLDEGEWRSGSEGYGYYENGIRTDFGKMFEDD